jgi:hypothetical protein
MVRYQLYSPLEPHHSFVYALYKIYEGKLRVDTLENIFMKLNYFRYVACRMSWYKWLEIKEFKECYKSLLYFCTITWYLRDKSDLCITFIHNKT